MACRPSVDHVTSSMDAARLFQMKKVRQKGKHTHNAEQWILHPDPGLPNPWLIKQHSSSFQILAD